MSYKYGILLLYWVYTMITLLGHFKGKVCVPVGQKRIAGFPVFSTSCHISQVYLPCVVHNNGNTFIWLITYIVLFRCLLPDKLWFSCIYSRQWLKTTKISIFQLCKELNSGIVQDILAQIKHDLYVLCSGENHFVKISS